MNEYENQIIALISNPDKLLQKAPFYRGYDMDNKMYWKFPKKSIGLNETVQASIPRIKKRIVTQDEFLMELEPHNHKVLYDQNIPSITMKLDNGGWAEIEYKKMAVSFQKNILDKQVMHLCGNQMLFTLMDYNPTDRQKEDFITYKQYWRLRNQDGMREKMVETQKSVGDAGLLYYYDRKGRIKSRILSYKEGFILCPHNDKNGDRILESVYYVKNDVEYIDSYDDKYMYRHIRENGNGNIDGWRIETPVAHGFSEIPLITKRGDVAWNDAQSVIEAYEILYNIFLVIQKRHGWGILYIKGKFDDTGKRIAGSVILNSKTANYGDNSTNSDDAKFLTPPSPQGTLDTLQLLEETIQKNSSTTFLLPKDVKTSGDISGVAILLTQTMDIEAASKAAIEWQNVADKMCRLFKEGLANELVNTGKQPTAITDFDNLNINASFKIWRPQSDTELVSRLMNARTGGFLSIESAANANPDSMPDEFARIQKEKELERQASLQAQEAQMQLSAKFASKDDEQGKSSGGGAKTEENNKDNNNSKK